jgi:hypothetical protein
MARMTDTPQPARAPSPQDALMQFISGPRVGLAIACLARLGVPDLVAEKPRSAADLAKELDMNPQALYRLMRLTAAFGVLAETPGGLFAQTPMSELLTRTSPHSLRAWCLISGHEVEGRCWGNLDYSIKTGKPAVEHLYGKPAFALFESDAELGALFNEAMTSLSSMDSPAVVNAYSFEGINSICDVAGGHGLLLAKILEKKPSMKGALYEMNHVLAGAADGPLKPFADRCSFIGGNMFESVPAGFDAYVMKHIIHDWPDDACLKILNACRGGVNRGGKLLIVENVIDDSPRSIVGKVLDIEMLLFPGGMERTESQFRELLAQSGWTLTRVIPTAAPQSVIEAIPA